MFRGPDVASRLYRAVLKPISFNYYWAIVGAVIDQLHSGEVASTQKVVFSIVIYEDSHHFFCFYS